MTGKLIIQRSPLQPDRNGVVVVLGGREVIVTVTATRGRSCKLSFDCRGGPVCIEREEARYAG